MNFTLIVLGCGLMGIGLGIVFLLFAEAAHKYKNTAQKHLKKTPGRTDGAEAI